MEGFQPGRVIEIQWQACRCFALVVRSGSTAAPFPRKVSAFHLAVRLEVLQEADDIEWLAPLDEGRRSPWQRGDRIVPVFFWCLTFGLVAAACFP